MTEPVPTPRTRMLWINPIHTPAYDAEMTRDLNEFAEPESTVDVLSFDPPGPIHLEYAAYGMAVAAPLLSAIRWARERGYDAACIGCFYDPGLRAAREVAGPMVVTAPAQACLHTAATLGSRVSVLVANRTCLAEAREAVDRTGLAGSVASYRLLDMRVPEFQQDPDRTKARMRTESRIAVHEDGADVLVLGCTLEYGLGDAVARELGVPVLDATSTTVAFAEHLASVVRRTGWAASPMDYESPPSDELAWLGPVGRPGPLTSAADLG